jgi:hypothetical protein
MNVRALHTAVVLILLTLGGCGDKGARSLVGDFAAPGTYALAGDTITVWKRIRQPDGAWRFHSYSITPGATVEYLEEPERVGAPENAFANGEERETFSELRKGFALPQAEFEAIRARAALLRPASLGPDDAIGGYGGEAPPAGCTLDKAHQRLAGVNFLNSANWGAFILQEGCSGQAASAATAAVTEIFDRLDRASLGVQARR